jgi:hypothetical protein
MELAILACLLVQVPESARIEAALRKAGERRYRMMENGMEVGSLKLTTSIQTVDGRKAAVFDDVFEVTLGGRKVEMVMKETARLEGLTLVSASRKGDGHEGKIAVAGQKATLTVEDRPHTLDLAGPTIGEQAAFRLVCAAEQKEGLTFKSDVLSFPAEELQKGHVFRCVSRETLEIGGKKRPAFKWTQNWEWKGLRNGIPTSSKVDIAYWVSPEGVLLRSTASGGGEIVLAAE